MWRLQESLAAIAGLPHVSLQPSAGSHGELAGVLLTRAFHEDHGETRTKVLTPDTAHGTNPGHGDDGRLRGRQGRHRRARATSTSTTCGPRPTPDVACLMLTNPSTLGLFEHGIEEIARIVHDVGATLYYDGANLNAIMGICRPGDMGFDIVHFNLHKSFTQPHGGGGPGAGPIAVADRIEPFLPRPAGGAAVGSDAPQRRRAVLRPRLRPAQVDRAPARLPGQLRRVRALLRLHPLAGRGGPARRLRGRRAQRQLPAGQAARRGRARAPAGRLRPHLHARVRPLGRADEARAGDQDPGPGQAPARPRRAPADGLLPAAGRGGAAHRADRDRDQGDPGPLRPDPGGHPARGGRATPRSPAPRPTPRRCGAWTRPRRRGGRSCARRSEASDQGRLSRRLGPCDSSSSAPARSEARWARACIRPGTTSA